MQRRIEELAAGICQSQSSILKFTPEKLEFEVLEGNTYIGKFSINNIHNIPIEGVIYTSSPRMECLNPRFQGTAITQEFQFHSQGLCEGDSQSGNFHIVSDQGEYILPFSMSVSRNYPDSSQGKIRSIIDFANLARKSYEEAVKVFAKPEFAQIFKEQEYEERLIYQGLCRKPCTQVQVEEFLVAARKKERVTFQVEEVVREYSNVTEPQKHYLTLKKDGWGYFAMDVKADGEWLQLMKHRFTDVDFVGSRGMVEYMVLPEKFHAGNNYGRLILETPFQREEIELCARGPATLRGRSVQLIQKKQIELTKVYLNFGFKKSVTGVWAKQTGRILEELLDLKPDNLWYMLAKAQVFLVNRQRQEAEWVLDAFQRKKVDKNTDLYAYYLYLCTLREPEPTYVNRCTSQIRKIQLRNQENPVLLWILLFLEEDLNFNKGRRLEVIERFLEQNGESVLLYLEAWRILEKEPFLLGRFLEFDRKILNFVVKHHGLTPGMVGQVVKLVPEIPSFDIVWYRILKACYQIVPGKETLQAVCSYCIKGQRYGNEYWKWYQLGVAEELRIAGLYEAWVLSADQEQMDKLPKPIVLYFQSYSNLASGPQAQLYAAMIHNKTQWKGVWSHYRTNIQEFAMRQLKAGKIDEAMAVIYREVLNPDMLVGEYGEDLARVLFTYEVSCDNSNASSVVVYQHPLKKGQVMPMIRGKGYVNIYSSSWKILLEDSTGRRFLPGKELKVRPLLDSEQFLMKGIACAKNKLPYLLKYFDKKKIWQTYEPEDLVYLQSIVDSKVISEIYREELRPQMVAYFYDNYTGDMLDEFLLNLSFEGIEKQAREKLMNLLVARHHYRRAYELLEQYGSERISPVRLVHVICRRLDEMEQEHADEFLLGLCRNVFLRGKYNEQILLYMCRYFHGSLEEMLRLWNAACNFELDTYELEEHCLERFLYTGDFLPDLEGVFEQYSRSQGKEQIILAYLTSMSHQHLVKDAVISDYTFHKLLFFLRQGHKLSFVCRMAFLKWCASQKNLVGEELDFAEELLDEALKNGIYFSFFQCLPQFLKEKYLFHDREVVEYHTDPGARVLIAYLPEGETEYVECEMHKMYDGIFAKEFLLFYGESLPYYIKEEQDGEWKVTQSGEVQRQQLVSGGEDSRYEWISDMMAGWNLKDETTVLKRLESYGYLDELVNKEFTVI